MLQGGRWMLPSGAGPGTSCLSPPAGSVCWGEDRARETLAGSLPSSQRPGPSLDTQEVASVQLDAAARLLPGTVTVTSAGTDWTISNESPQSFARMLATEDVKGGNSHSQPK